MDQKGCSGFLHWIFWSSRHTASPHTLPWWYRADREEASLVPEWSFICRGFPYTGNFQPCNPATIPPVGLPVSQVLKHSLNSGRGSVLIPLHPWRFLIEGKSRGVERPAALGHVRMGNGLGNSFPAHSPVKGHRLPLPHLGHPDSDTTWHKPGLPGPARRTPWGQSCYRPTIRYLDRILKNCNRKCITRHGT